MIYIEERLIKISDLRSIQGIGDKTIEKIKEQLNIRDRIELNNKYMSNIKPPSKLRLELNDIYLGESVKFMRENMPSNVIDLTVTSPPYDKLRDYDGYEFDYKMMLNELYRITKSGGTVVWVVGDATVNGSETGTSFKQALYAKEIGFNLHDTMIYEKNTSAFPANPKSNRYTQIFEYMFVFNKGKINNYNLICDKENKWAGYTNWGANTDRAVDGTLNKKRRYK